MKDSFVLLKAARWVRGHALVAVCIVALSALLEGSALLALGPLFNRQFSGGQPVSGLLKYLTRAIEVAPGDLLPLTLVVFGALGLTSAAVRMGADALLVSIRSRVEELARERMTDALTRMRWEAFTDLKLGEIGKSIYQEGWYIGVGVQVLLQALGLMGAISIYLCLAALISPALTIFGVGLGVGLAFAARGLSARAREHTERFMSLNADLSNRLQELFSNLKFYRATGIVENARSIGKVLFRNFADAYFRAYVVSPVTRAFLEASAFLFIAGILYAGLVIAQRDLGGLVIFLALFLRAAPRLVTLQDLLFQAATYQGWYRDWEERLTFALTNQETDVGAETVEFRDRIRLRDVTVAYANRDHPVLRKLSLDIGAREFIAIVGPSGSGKSTLIDLLTGIVRPSAGVVEVDGVDLRELSLSAWRRRLGVVLQDTPVFFGTAFENVTWGSEEKDETKAHACLVRAHADPVIAAIPGGLHGQLGERGGRLSGGERQRIALARALYREPLLLILDEATSALDSLSEEEILRAIRELKGRCAIVMVAHRLSTVRDADRIVVLSDGVVVEQGEWTALVGQPGGALREMVRRQDLYPFG